jgi:Na+/H+ antiporter NhaC
MWLGVSKAGYSVREELPYFFVVFLIPAIVALLIWWRYSGG